MKHKRKTSPIREEVHLTGFNRLFLHLLITPVFTLLYYPVNRYVMLPKLGSGAPYTNMSGVLIEHYFSANSLVRVLEYLLIAVTLFFTVLRCRELHGVKRIVFLMLCILGCITSTFLFLEFSLWDTAV